MSIKELKKRVLEANLDLVDKKLVISTWGNVSGFDEESGLIAIKASGVKYAEMKEEHITVLNMSGDIIEGSYAPSTDAPTHLALYRKFASLGIRGIVHTHSQFATMWAQSGNSIPCLGTTHADYFFGEIPCTRRMTPAEIEKDYEENTGNVIIETFENKDPKSMQAVLVCNHAPFVWGKSPEEAVSNSQVLEFIAKMAYCNITMSGWELPHIQQELANKHYGRKFGPDAYYGQR